MTLGDNNSKVDSPSPGYGDVVGRVVYALRKRKKIRIHGGIPGRIYAIVCRSTRQTRKYAFRVAGYAYWRAVKWSVRRYLFPPLRTKIVVFKRPGGAERHLLLGRWVIGRYDPGSHRWDINPPFRLFIDETALLTEDHKH